MELTGILFLVVVLLCFTLFIFALVKAFSGWGVLYTIVLVFTFLSCLTFLFAAAGVASRRIAWVRVHDQLKQQVDKLEEEAKRLKYGDIYRPTADLDSLVPIANEVSRLTVERGRTWRGATLTKFEVDSVRLTMAAKLADAPPPGGVQAPPTPEVNGDLPVEHLVYAYSEDAGEDGKVLPKTYLGEYVVAESQGGSAVLRPVVELLPTQITAAKNSTSWTIFEMLPLDSHVAFAEPNSKRTNENEFGRMDAKVIAELLNIQVDLLERDISQLNPDEATQAKLLRSYVEDGSRARENELPGNIWNRIEFLKDHTDKSVDSEEKRIATDGGYFDSSGRTVDARLRRPEKQGEIAFKKGQQVLFIKSYADQLIEQGIAKLIEPIFVRPINDYSIAFNEARTQATRALQDAETLKRQIEQVQATIDVAQEQVVFRRNEEVQLTKDRTQYDKELVVITSETERLTQAVQDTKSELSRLYRASQEHYDRMVRTQQSRP
ncbi:MAG: hypothetical protein SGI77_08440 [Pirellulaceae bacterium]|nr:hypothetical protein [Pirellulaceae bacterium]